MYKRLMGYIMQPAVVISTVAVVSIIAVIAAYFYIGKQPVSTYVAPVTGPIVQQVSADGTVKAAESVDLSFQTSGRIASVYAPVGLHVSSGSTLASLSADQLSAQLESAKAALAVQQANLAGLQAGTRPEDVAVSQTAVTGAQVALAQANQSVVDAARDAYIKSDDALHNKVDQLLSNPRSNSPMLNISLSDSQLQNSIEGQRVTMESLLTQWQEALNALPADSSSIDTSATASMARTDLAQLSAYLDLVANGLTKALPSTSLSQSSIQVYQSNIAAGRSNLSVALSAVNAADIAQNSARSNLATSQSQLALKQAGATPTNIQAQVAQVASAQAAVDQVLAQLGNTVIRAPFSGTITRNDAHAGATASPGVALISIDSDAKFQIEAYVSEADVAKVHAANAASIALDAYQGQTFPAHVVSIDPAATLANGIASYKVVLQFDANDPRILAGLTGTVTITTQSKDSALTVPSSAIIMRGNDTYVLRQSTGADELVKVTTGIVGADTTEITSGLTAGDRIRAFGSQ